MQDWLCFVQILACLLSISNWQFYTGHCSLPQISWHTFSWSSLCQYGMSASPSSYTARSGLTRIPGEAPRAILAHTHSLERPHLEHLASRCLDKTHQSRGTDKECPLHLSPVSSLPRRSHCYLCAFKSLTLSSYRVALFTLGISLATVVNYPS